MLGRFSNLSVYTDVFQSNDFLRIAFGGMLIPLGFFFSRLFVDVNFLGHTFLDFFLIGSIVVNGLPIMVEAYKGVIRRRVNVDELVSIAILACLLVGEYFEAAVVSFIMVTGAFLEEYISDSARGAIRTLVEINPDEALVEDGAAFLSKKTKDIVPGEVVIVKAGETIPVDGEIIEGRAFVDESLLNGESFPVLKQEKDAVAAGTFSTDGLLRIKTTRQAEESTLSRIIELVQHAENSKIDSTKLVDKYAGFFTPVILSLAILTFFLTRDIDRAITVLIVGCPCSFILTGPVTTVAAVSRAAKAGIMVKGGIFLEHLSRAAHFYFDKTGTLTLGKPVVVSTHLTGGFDEREVFSCAAAVEKGSTHPLAHAILARAQDLGVENRAATDICNVPGSGIKGVVEEKEIEVVSGSSVSSKGETCVEVKIDGRKAAEIFLFDESRPEVRQMIHNLYTLGIKTIALVSGDGAGAVQRVASEAGIGDYYYSYSPEEKMKLLAQQEHTVFVGDGINDAPALKAASTGISMGEAASETALETADIVLMNDRIALLPFLVKISRRMTALINVNLLLALGINFIAILLSMGGKLSPISGALAHNFGAILVAVIASSLLVMKNEFEEEKK